MAARWTFKWGSVLLVLAAILYCPIPAALAQTEAPRVPTDGSNADGMDTHLFRPALDSKGFFATNGSDIIGAGDISFGLVLDYGKNLLRTTSSSVPLDDMGLPCKSERCVVAAGQEGTGVKALVEDSYQGTLGFNYGIANRAVVGVAIPVILMTGNRAYQIGPTGGLYNSGQLDAEKISTLALHGKVRLTRVADGIGIAATLQGGIPMGDSPRALGGDPGAWFWPQLVVENQFGFTRRFKVGLNVGYRGHTGSNAQFGNDPTGQPQLKEGFLEYGNLATYGLGVSWRVADSLDLVGETYGTSLLGTASDSKQLLSQEAVGGIKLFVERNSFLMMGGGTRITTGFQAADLRLILGFVFEPSIGDRDGDGIKDDQDACPDDPEDFDGFEDADGCPDPDNDKDGIPDVDDRCPNVPEDFDGDQDEDGCPEGDVDGDRDGDGIPDSIDRCPDEPEDRDGFQDADGCPEPDNDKDGILDVDDQCPNDPENFNGFQDEDGCPDQGLVVVEGSDLVILQKVQFETGSAKILPESDPILEAVAATLKGQPDFLVLEVAGHADERSTDEYNLRLTKQRAAAVAANLQERGIAASRLVSQGYGEYCPLDPSSNEAAWEKNRRVEFKVVKTRAGLTNVTRGCDRAVKAGVLPPRVQ
jgi:OOP family OmpA-OmpF porin